MKTKNKEFCIYVCILILSAVQIFNYLSIHIASGDEIAEIAIPVVEILFLTIGLIYFGIAIMIALGMWRYHIGKLFSIQLFLIAVASLGNFYMGELTKVPMNVLLVSSNACLFAVIAKITGLYQGKLFRRLMCIQVCISILQLFYIIITMNTQRHGQSIIMSNYFITFTLVMLMFGGSYKKVTTYSKRQIKILIKSLTIGMLLYCVLSVVDILEISSSMSTHENTIKMETNEIVIDDEIQGISFWGIDISRNSTLPVIAFAIVTFRILFVLIRKEYFASEAEHWIKQIIKSILVMLVVNLIIAMYFVGPAVLAFIINIIFVVVMARIEYKSFAKNANQGEVRVLEEAKCTLSMYLHDEILQDVFTIKNTAKINPEMEEKLTVLVAKIRNLSNDLFPLIVENMGLNKSLEIHFNELRKENAIEFDYEFRCSSEILELHLETTLYRNVKELVNNAIKHAEASRISIVIDCDKSSIWAIVSDDGKGFEVTEMSDLIIRKSIGLYSIYKQSRDLGGQLKLYSNVNTGTECMVKLPL